jgi:hypothetical protein
LGSSAHGSPPTIPFFIVAALGFDIFDAAPAGAADAGLATGGR